MDAQDIRNLQEAYMEVVMGEGKVPWNDPKNPNPSGYTPKEKSEAKRKQLGVDNPDTKSFEKGGPGEKEYARHGNLAATQEKMKKSSNQPKGKPHQFKKNPFWKKDSGQVRRDIFGTQVPKNKRSSYESSKKGGPFFAKEEVDIYDIILSHLLDEGYAETVESAEAIMVNMSEDWRESIMIDEGLDMKTFKANRKKAKASAARADAVKRGHVGKEWYNSGRRYSPDEAKRMRSNLDDEERRTRHRSAVDPDNEDDNNYSADKTKNPKKLRKQKAMGELG